MQTTTTTTESSTAEYSTDPSIDPTDYEEDDFTLTNVFATPTTSTFLDLPKVVPATDFAAATEPSDNELSRTKERPRVQILKKSGKPAPVEPQESSRRVPVAAGPQEVLRRVPVEPQEILRQVPEDRVQVSSTAAPRRLVIPTGLRARRPQSPSIIDSIPLEPTVLPRAPPSRTSPVPRILAAVPRAPTPVPRAPVPVPQAPVSVPRTPVPVPRTVSRAPASTAPFQTLFQARTQIPQLRQPGFAPIAIPRAPVAVPRAPVAVPRAPVDVPRTPVAVPRTPVEAPRRQQAFATKAPTTTQDPFTIFSFDRAQQRIPQQPQPAFAQPQRPRNNLNKPQALPRKFEVIKPTTKNPKNLRGRVPILDRYTIHNDDGSFTWGYQSADGSFKEETIGNDCVTRGR